MGYLVKRGVDRWACVIYLDRQRGADGKAKERRLWRTVRGSKADARRLLLTLERQHERRELEIRRETVATYLTRWLTQIAPRTAGPTTLESYGMIIEKHLIPSFGSLRLDRLTSRKIDDYLGEKMAKGRSEKHPVFKKTPALSSETIRRHYRVLHKALQDAVAEGTLPANPAARPHVRPPKRERKEMRVLNELQVRRFLEVARASRLRALFELAVLAGLRQAELLGARWQDLNLDLGVLSIQQIYYRGLFKPPKTERSRRTIELDAHLVDVLRNHQRQQKQERQLFSQDYQDHDLLFCQPDGRPLSGQSLARNEYRRLLKQAGCPLIRFHDLRHTCATWHGQMGTPLKTISDLLGHSGVAITGDLYAHTITGMQRQATSQLTARLAALQAQAAATESNVADVPPEAVPGPEAASTDRLQGQIH